MDTERVDTVVVGAGHAGLAVSRLLTQAGRDHVVLDRGRVAERWRSERWDSLHLLTPNWMTRLPGWYYSGPDPGGTSPRGSSSGASSGTPTRSAHRSGSARPCAG
jgi:putative flavoprotein involved in K+ transport